MQMFFYNTNYENDMLNIQGTKNKNFFKRMRKKNCASYYQKKNKLCKCKAVMWLSDIKNCNLDVKWDRYEKSSHFVYFYFS